MGAANIFQLTARGGDAERMFITFSKEDLLLTTKGRQLATAPGNSDSAESGANGTVAGHTETRRHLSASASLGRSGKRQVPSESGRLGPAGTGGRHQHMDSERTGTHWA